MGMQQDEEAMVSAMHGDGDATLSAWLMRIVRKELKQCGIEAKG